MNRLAELFRRTLSNPARGCPHNLKAETEGGTYCRTCGAPLDAEPRR